MSEGKSKEANRVKITKTSVEKLIPPTEGYKLFWDTDIKGFGLRITHSNVRSFILQTRINGRSKRLTLGRYPGVSPVVARTQAKQVLGEIAGGGDPVASKHREKLENITLEKAFQEYFKAKDLRPATVHGMTSELENTFGRWKKKPLTKITRRMVEKCYLERVQESKSRANVAMRYLRAVFNLAIAHYRDSEDQPIIQSNPVNVLSESKLWRKVPRRKTILKPDDLNNWVPAVMSLGKAPTREPGTGKQFPKLRNGEVYRDLLLFLALTGCRKSEPLGLKKTDVNIDRGFVNFRDTKNRSTHELPLTGYLKHLLEQRMGVSPNDWVFASPHDGAVPTNFRTLLSRLHKQTGLSFTFHDLRRLAATTMERQGVPSYTVKAVLNHATGAADVTGGYMVVDDDMKLEALLKLERFILKHGEQGKVIDITNRLTEKQE